jgi:hypothetical protein
MSAPPLDPRHRQRTAWTIAAVGALLLLAAAVADRKAALQSYLFVWWFLLGIPLGSLAILAVHNLTGGRWGELIRPALEAALRMLPVTLLLSIPLWLGLSDLYVWARPEDVSASPLLQTKAWYLDPVFFLARAAIYAVVWLALSHFLGKWSLARAPGTDPAAAQRMRAASAIGLLVYGVTVTFAAVDWIMSLSPQWYSTTFGLLSGIGQSLCAFSFAIVCAVWLFRGEHDDLPGTFQDLGNLLLMFVMTWAYLAFTQYLIIWAEDLPNEIVWYLPRVQTSWRLVAIFLVVFHFALPFLVLLSRRAKRAPQSLGILAAMLLFAHLVDSFWLVTPTFRPTGFAVHWSDLFAALVLGGIWLALFVRGGAAGSTWTRSGARREVIDHV